MLNGRSPVLIFQFKKKVVSQEPQVTPDSSNSQEQKAKIPILSDALTSLIDQPPIPFYLSDDIGFQVISDDKNVDFETDTETLQDGGEPLDVQQGIDSSVTINFVSVRSNVAIGVISALIDTCFKRASSNEYTVSFLNGPTTVFRGKIQSFQYGGDNDSDKVQLQLIITNGKAAPKVNQSVVRVLKQEKTIGITDGAIQSGGS